MKQPIKHQRCVIVGGGASGAMMALEILRTRGEVPIEIRIVDPAPELGRGRAYGRENAADLLNVRASRMSANPSDPEEFTRWLGERSLRSQDFPFWHFVPRVLYGDYLSTKIAAFIGHGISHIRAKVISVSARRGEYLLRLDNGTSLTCEMLVLCTGYTPAPASSEFDNAGRRAAIIGSGLTAIDFWRRLRVDPDRQITLLSRRGLFPVPHLKTPHSVRLPRLQGLSPLQIFSIVRRFQEISGAPWPDIADAVRDEAQTIWSTWSRRERGRFLRHLLPYWEIVRHRMPDEIRQELDADIAAGRVRIIVGTYVDAENASGRGYRLNYRPRASEQKTSAEFDSVHLATGTAINQELGHSGAGLPGLRACQYGLGYLNGDAYNLWLIGPASKAGLWEVTAVPEIRNQVVHVAQKILGHAREDGDRKLWRWFTHRLVAHPKMVNEGYFEHFRTAVSAGFGALGIAYAIAVHGILPFLFNDTGSDRLRNMAYRFSLRRNRAYPKPRAEKGAVRKPKTAA